MNVGDLVIMRKSRTHEALGPKTTGLIIDTMEMADGFTEYEVMFEDWGIGWFSDLILESADEQE